MRKFRLGLFAKFLLLMGGMALIPVSFFAYRSAEISQVSIEDSVLELHTKLAEKMADKVANDFKSINLRLSYTVAALQKDLTWEDKQELLRTLRETNSDISEISFVNDGGAEFLRFPPKPEGSEPTNRTGEEGFKEYQSRKTRTMLLSKDPPSAEYYFPLSKTVAARFFVTLEELAESIASERVGGTGYAVMTDKEGKPLFFPEGRFSEDLRAKMPDWTLVKGALQSDSPISERVPATDLVGAARSVAIVGGAMVILQSYDEAYAGVIAMRRSSIQALLAVLFVSILGATFMARRMTAPLLALSQGAEAISRREFKTQIVVTTGDELQDLAETFNRMTVELGRYSELQVDQLVAEQRKTSAILFSINDGILMTNLDNDIQLVNRQARQYMGLDPAAALEDKPLAEVLPESDLRKAILEACADSKSNTRREVDLSTKEIRKFLQVTAYPVVSPKTKETLGIVTALRDVTFEKELEQMKKDFTNAVTHDLRSPLGSATTFSEMLLKGTYGPLPQAQANIVTSILRSLRRQMALVNNILDIAKMESGEVPLQLTASSLPEIARRAMNMLEALFVQKKLKFAVEADQDFTVNFDTDLLERVFSNLLGNAIKYTPAGGSVTVSFVDKGSEIMAVIADTGMGIPESYLTRVFEKFEQVTGQRKGGTGLGLTITRFFIESHLGKIWVESELKKGSRFCFTIPKNLVADKDGKASVGAKAA